MGVPGLLPQGASSGGGAHPLTPKEQAARNQPRERTLRERTAQENDSMASDRGPRKRPAQEASGSFGEPAGLLIGAALNGC